MTNGCTFEVIPYDQSGRIKNPNLVNINFTNQDFWSMKDRLKAYIKQQFGEQFNDFIESDLAIVLIENWAFIADTISFKIDQIANEIFIDTVGEVTNAFRISKLVGFQPTPPIAASSMWSATITSRLTTDLVIATPVRIDISTEAGPRTVELYAADPAGEPRFQDDIIISSGSFLNTTIVGLEGFTHTDGFSGTSVINQFYQLGSSPVIWDSVRVAVDGMSWTQVDYFTDSQPRKEFRVEFDASYNAFVIFGDGIAGMVPADGSQISVTYRAGGGVAGNIVTGAIEIQRNFIVPGLDFRIPVTFRNYTKGQFGYDGDGLADVKRKLPGYLRTQNRVVTGDDYDSFVNTFTTPYNGSVGKGTAALRHHGCSANIIDIYILAQDGSAGLAVASNDLKVALKTALRRVNMISHEICIKDGNILEVDVDIDIVMPKFYRKFEDEFQTKINTRITSFFSLNNWVYGQSLTVSELLKQLSDIKEISSTSIHFLTEDEDNSGDLVVAKYNEIIRPQDINISFVYQ